MQCQDNSSFPAKIKEDQELVDAAVRLLSGALTGDVRATRILSTSVDQLRDTNGYTSLCSGMTRRQIQVLFMFNEGKSCREICTAMTIQPSTLRDYKAAICNYYGTRPIDKALERARSKGDVPMVEEST